MTGQSWTTHEPEPMVMVDPELSEITVAAHGGIVPLSFDEARQVIEAMTNLLAVHDPQPEQYRPGPLEVLADQPGGLEQLQESYPTESWLHRHPG